MVCGKVGERTIVAGRLEMRYDSRKLLFVNYDTSKSREAKNISRDTLSIRKIGNFNGEGEHVFDLPTGSNDNCKLTVASPVPL